MPILRRPARNPGSGSGGGQPCVGDGGHGERSGAARAENLLLVLDEGHHLPDVARDALEMSAEITAPLVPAAVGSVQQIGGDLHGAVPSEDHSTVGQSGTVK